MQHALRVGVPQRIADLHQDTNRHRDVEVSPVGRLEPLDCGQDTQTPVSPAYPSPFRFTGTIHQVRLEVHGKDPIADPPDPAAEERAAMTQQ